MGADLTRNPSQQEFLAREILAKISNPTHWKLSDQALDFLICLVTGAVRVETDEAGKIKVFGYEAIGEPEAGAPRWPQ